MHPFLWIILIFLVDILIFLVDILVFLVDILIFLVDILIFLVDILIVQLLSEVSRRPDQVDIDTANSELHQYKNRYPERIPCE